MWAIQRALKFKVLQSGSERGEERNAGLKDSKEDFVFWWLALPKRVSLGRQQGTGWTMKGIFGGFRRDVNYSFGEKEVCQGWDPSLWQRHGPFSGSAALGPQRGDFFIYLFNFMPCRPLNGLHSHPKTTLSSRVTSHPNPLSKETDP